MVRPVWSDRVGMVRPKKRIFIQSFYMKKYLLIAFIALSAASLTAQITPSPLKNDGMGPYSQLIIRGVTLINGTGAPAYGPVDIVIEKNKIVQIANLGLFASLMGTPGLPKLAI